MHQSAIIFSSAIAGLLASPAAATSTTVNVEHQDRMLSTSNSNDRSWPNLIPKRRTIPPYDRYRWALVTEWDPFSDLPPAALQSDEKSAAGPTPRPSSLPTWEGYEYDILDQLPPAYTAPTPAPTFGPTTLDDWADSCGVDGYGFLSTVTLKDKWGDGWDGAFLTIRDAATQMPVYSGTLRGNDGKERTDHVCLQVWSCYEVVVTGSQWSDEISWSIDRLETDYFWLLEANRQVERAIPLEDQLAEGVANQRCTFALTDVSLMDGCAATCDGNQPTGTVGVVNEEGELTTDDDGGDGGGDDGDAVKTKVRRPTSAPTVAPSPQPTLSDDFGDFNGGGRQPTVPIGFGSNGGTGTALRPTSNFPFTNPFQNPFQQRPVSTGGAEATVRDGATSSTGTNMDGTAVIRGTARPTSAPTTAKPTLPPAFQDPNMPYRPPGYFNYDPFDGYYGPVAWSKWFPGCGVGVTEFDQSGVGLEGSIGDGRQAPIHVGEDGMNVECEATHEIRTRAAEFSLCDDEAGLFSITPSRLRLDFTAKDRNPWTDLPDGFGSMDAKYLEVAYPALHTIEENGRRKRYDAEYTIVHDFDRREKATLVSILIDATGFKNERLQDLLDEWTKVDTCRTPVNEEQFMEQIQRNEKRKLRAEPQKLNPANKEDGPKKQRDLACSFNIYHRTLMPSTYYYAYQGSLPEPPCTYKDYLPGTSEWRVINKPMKISPEQLDQLKALVEFGPCKDNEFAQDLGVWRARPVQESDARPYWQCKRDAFPLDCEKDGYCDCDAVLCAEDFE